MSEQFKENIAAFEQAQWGQLFDVLTESGVQLPSPLDLNDTEITRKLWEVIDALALIGVQLENTNHLSDCELYEVLWEDCLREETVFQSPNLNMVCHLDIIGSGSDEDIRTFLKYYADENERSDWAKDFPGEEMPSREKQPYDRDRKLPTPKHQDNTSLH